MDSCRYQEVGMLEDEQDVSMYIEWFISISMLVNFGALCCIYVGNEPYGVLLNSWYSLIQHELALRFRILDYMYL